MQAMDWGYPGRQGGSGSLGPFCLWKFWKNCKAVDIVD
jgi:hypothetical protein